MFYCENDLLHQCFSNFNVYKNHIGIWRKIQTSELCLQLLICTMSKKSRQLGILANIPGGSDASGLCTYHTLGKNYGSVIRSQLVTDSNINVKHPPYTFSNACFSLKCVLSELILWYWKFFSLCIIYMFPYTFPDIYIILPVAWMFVCNNQNYLSNK